MQQKLELLSETMTKRLFVDIKEDCNGNLTEKVKFPADGVFVFEALLEVLDQYSKSVEKETHEVIQDMYNYRRLNPK